MNNFTAQGRVIGVMVWFLSLAGTIAYCGQPPNTELRQEIAGVLIGLTHSPPGTHGHLPPDLLTESVNAWKDKPEVIPILMDFVAKGLNLKCDRARRLLKPCTRQDYETYDCARNAIELLGRLRAKPASRLLAEAAGRVDIVRFFQEGAIIAVIRIGDTNMLPFARRACTDVTAFTSSDRFTVYDSIINLHLTPEADEQQKQEIIRLFMEAESIEIGQPGVLRLDPVICEYNDQWKRSYEREEVLKKFKGCETWLADIKKLPADQRTHIAVRKLQVKEGPRAYHPNDPNAPKPAEVAASAVTNTPVSVRSPN